jgi:hypothetical protein
MKKPFAPQHKRTLTRQEKSRMGLAHFTHEEMQNMIFLQGEEIIDPTTNIPAFPKLSAVFKNPKVRLLFKEVRDLTAAHGRVPMVLKRIAQSIEHKEPLYNEIRPKSPLGRKIKGNDIGKDTQIALVPIEVLAFFDDLRGTVKLNPRDGLPLYFIEWLSPALAIAGMGMSLFGGDDEEGESQAEWYDRKERRNYEQAQKEKEERRAEKNAAGFNIGFNTERTPLLEQWDLHRRPQNDPILHLKNEEPPAFKTGGLIGKPIKGRGNGQSDDIKVDTTKEGEWIWDASTVADLGDGATDAGWKEIRRLEETIKKAPGFKDMHEFKPGLPPRIVKTALSNGEYRTPTKIVTAIGQGDNAKGADVLRTMTEEIRRYKNSNGDKLPPPIKDPLQFFKKAVHQERGS